ncbi:hypothetical protein SCHPADRAFT_664396 [Schizopora paradoxa]|uniref:MYND-type domain-containing protein n=1 Tax=Schizopora paradoxa TaxID=27342 RepID=A0A0H2R6Y3_9AGAM|nr:hypothetical protein SCHPADRAFT_664396 [Schizopora paradoxa]
MSTNPALSIRQRARERARQPKQHTDQEMRHIMSTVLPRAKNGSFRDMQFFGEGVGKSSQFIVQEVFEAFLEHLQASKVPLIDATPASLDRSPSDLKVERAVTALRVLGSAARHIDLIQTKPEICELLVARWPDLLAWMWYFYHSYFEKNSGSRGFKMEIYRCICMVFMMACLRDKYTLAIAEVNGSIQLATLLCMVDTKGTFLNRETACLGLFTLLHFLQIQVTIASLDEVLEALGGNAKPFMDVTIARLEDTFNAPEIVDRTTFVYTTIFLVIGNTDSVIGHPIWVAMRAKNPIVILTNAVRRVLDILPTASSGRYGPDSASKLRHFVTTVLFHISTTLLKDSVRVKLALQALQAEIMTALIDCAPLAFSFRPFDRDAIVKVLKQLTWLTMHLPVARQASAELEKLERTCSVQGRFNASTLDVRNAWVTFYDAILARRTILEQMQTLDSTPMACDNCFRFDERANFKKCAGCGMTHYCSRDCQSRAWKEKGHRDECKTLKNNTSKRKQRTVNQEKYFLARIAVNDAQHKKEQLGQMARMGLKKLSVSLDYIDFPPSCFINCNMEELDSFGRETTEMMQITRKWLERCREALPQSSSESSTEIPDSVSYTEVALPDNLS